MRNPSLHHLDRLTWAGLTRWWLLRMWESKQTPWSELSQEVRLPIGKIILLKWKWGSGQLWLTTILSQTYLQAGITAHSQIAKGSGISRVMCFKYWLLELLVAFHYTFTYKCMMGAPAYLWISWERWFPFWWESITMWIQNQPKAKAP